MASKMQQGYLVLADISGYTSFLAKTELDHAHEIMSELLELIVRRMQPPLTLSKLEGDAVFVYAPDAELSRPDMLLDVIESTYVAFRDRLRNMQSNTTCRCAACRAMPQLDLKFMAHHGSYILQSVVGHSEVVGSDVNLAHRLLKNAVGEETGWRAYALFSQDCLEKIGLSAAAMHTGSEEYEHLGRVGTHSFDLRARYKEIVEARRVVVEPGEADVVIEHDFAAPPPVIWDWITDPAKRNLWSPEVTWTAGIRPNGRTGPGARDHCAHGQGSSTQEILDWRPFDYVTTYNEEDGKGPQMSYTMTFKFEPGPLGTHLTLYIKGKMPVPGFLNRIACNFIFKQMFNMRKLLGNIDRLIAEQGAGALAPA